MYDSLLDKEINIQLNPNEHQAYQWMTPQEAYAKKDLVHGSHDLLELVFNLPKKNNKKSYLRQ